MAHAEKEDKLVVLDINGVFCRKLTPEETRELKGVDGIVKLEGSKFTGGVEFRPGYLEFFDRLLTKYHVAIFSSTTHKNASSIIQASQLKSQEFDFLWYRDRTRFDPEGQGGEIQSFETIKMLNDIYDNPIVNMHRQWSDRNTIIIDDSSTKVRFNKSENVLVISSFKGASEGDNYLLEVAELIDAKFAALDDKE